MILLIAFFPLAGDAGSALADGYLRDRVDLKGLPQHLERRQLAIPVGCDLVDCCPGCPVPESMTWKIHLEGEFIEGALLEFENLSEERAKALRLSGNSQRVAWNRIQIGLGDSTIVGLPGNALDRPTVGLVRLLPAGEVIERHLSSGLPDGGDIGEIGWIVLSIEQMLLQYLAHSYKLKIETVTGLFAPVDQDRIRLFSNQGGDESHVLVDGRVCASGPNCCADDLQFKVSGVKSVQNFYPPGGCRSEAFAFSRGDAAAAAAPVPLGTWTVNGGDELPVPLDNPLNLPMNIWRIGGTTQAEAAMQVAKAVALFDLNKTGIRLEPHWQTIADTTAAGTAVGTFGDACAKNLPATGYYVPQQLNVYYVANGGTGTNCGALNDPYPDRNVIYMGEAALDTTLAHEIGHALSLHGDFYGGHTNWITDAFGQKLFDFENLMWGLSPSSEDARRYFSIGQAFRFNMNKVSKLRENGVRTTPPERACLPDYDDEKCPKLEVIRKPYVP